jgi:hypothetical protein
VRCAVIAAFADADPFQTAQKARSGVLGGAAFRGRNLIIPFSYQAIVSLANSVSDHPDEWNALAEWIERKIRNVAVQPLERSLKLGASLLQVAVPAEHQLFRGPEALAIFGAW